MSMASMWTDAMDQVLAGTDMDMIHVECPFCHTSLSITQCISHMRDEHIEFYLLWISIANPEVIPFIENALGLVGEDDMNYESLLALCDEIGYESKGVQNMDAVTQRVLLTDTPDLASERCTICLEHFKDDPCLHLRQITKCHHMFHEECIEKWLSKNKTCPICVQYVDEESPR